MKEKKYSFFPSYNKADWIEAAKNELEGVHPFDKLVFTKEEVRILPYYDLNDALNKVIPALPISDNTFFGPRTWLNLAYLTVSDSNKANKAALSHLASGADGIFFNLQSPSGAAELLREIELPFCGVGFLIDQNNASFIEDFLHYVVAKENYLQRLSGAIFWKSESIILKDVVEDFKSSNHFYSNGIVTDETLESTDQISSLLAKAVKRIDSLTDQGLNLKMVLSATAFSLPIQTDFFLEIAKLKALRLLWSQLARAYDNSFESPLFIHCYSPSWDIKDYQPHGNMLKSTTTALSAILGGCDSLSIMPEDQSNLLLNRIARNVSSILREESHLSHVADPTSGSYYIEYLTDQLAQQSWSKFQKLVTV
jgi:methylmalonyl-CoA mutase